jgi:DNA repair exonuclease SbcCD ATPase subunit
MKISLENFKCWGSASFDLGESGITLIKGNSGKGKSSILDAIYFGLYGKGMKLLKVGTKSCKVVLETKNISITRTKGPNRLLVQRGNDIYEDKAAQSVIDEVFTHNYDGTGYMKQNDQNSFILLSPTDKLAFIEQYAFLGVDIQVYKESIKDIQKKRDSEMTAISANVQMTADVLADKEEPEEVAEPRIVDKKVISQKIEKCDTSIKKTQKSIEKYQTKLEKRGNLQTFIQTTLSSIEELKATTVECMDANTYSKYKTDLQDKKTQLSSVLEHKQQVIDYKQLQKDKRRTNELYNKEKKRAEDRRGELEGIVWKEYSKETCKRLMKELEVYEKEKEVYEDAKNRLDKLTSVDISGLDTRIHDIQTLIGEVEISNKTYACPSCKKHLYISGGVLQSCDTKKMVDKTEYESYKKQLESVKRERDRGIQTNNTMETLQKQIQQFTEKTIDDVSSYYEKQIPLEMELTSLTKKIDRDDFLSSVRKDLAKREEAIGEMNTVEDIDEESLRSQIHELESTVKDNERVVKENKKIKNKIQQMRESIRAKRDVFIQTFGDDEDPSGVIQEKKETLQALTKKLDTYKDLRLQVEKYNQYKTDYADYKTWCDKYDDLQKDEIEMSNKVCSINTLRDLVADAESLAITNVMNRIEDIVQDYLDLFFVDEPLSIKLNTFKEDKKKKSKAQINVVMEYKGMECTVGMLSGGELQRVMLAFNLAMSEIYNLPFMLLDETMSNLDEDTTQVLVDGIKEKCSDKLVVIIAHQVVSGVFDKTIEIQ